MAHYYNVVWEWFTNKNDVVGGAFVRLKSNRQPRPHLIMALSAEPAIKGLIGRVGRIFGRKPAALPTATPLPVKLEPILLGQNWTTVEFPIPASLSSVRLDRAITSQYDISRSLLQKLLRKHLITLRRPDTSGIIKMAPGGRTRVKEGDVITMSEIFLPERRKNVCFTTDYEPSEDAIARIKERVLYKDEKIIILDKPAGMAVHGGPKIEQHLGHFLEALKFELPDPPYIIHRLDRYTSGAMLLARTRPVASEFSAKLNETSPHGSIRKYYWAMVIGKSALKFGEIISKMYRVCKPPKEKMTSVADWRKDLLDEGKVAITRYRTLGEYRNRKKKIKLTMLEMVPLTGRTHQLRVHALEQLKTPIVGDTKYKGPKSIPKPLHLHSRRIQLLNYFGTGKCLDIEAPIPSHFVKTMTEYPRFLRTKPKLLKPKRFK